MNFTWQRIMTCVTFGLLSLVSVLSSPVRTESTKSPGWLWLSLTRKLPFLPFSVNSFSASRPDRWPWNHLAKKRTMSEECFRVQTPIKRPIKHNYRLMLSWKDRPIMSYACAHLSEVGSAQLSGYFSSMTSPFFSFSCPWCSM